MKRQVLGLPIPLHYLTPNLLFYPFKCPENILFFLTDKNVNCIDKKYIINLDKMNHLYFVETLMNCLGVSFMIVNDFVIDLDRKDFEISMDDETKTIKISKYESINNITYITEKHLKNTIQHLNLEYDINITNDYRNNNDVNFFINQHCYRIVRNTKKIKDSFFHKA